MDTSHVLLLGPSGVGKTTLLTSIVQSARAFLDAAGRDSRERLELLLDEPGEARLQSLAVSLRDAALGRAFSTPALAPTRSPEVWNVSVRRTRRGVLGRVFNGMQQPVSLSFHDYPGKLIEDLPAMASGVVPLARARVVIVPVDAALFMEAETPDQEVAAQALHAMNCMEELIVEWVKGRAKADGGLLVLAPVRCESYFTDNGLSRPGGDQSQRLADLVCNRYFSSALDIISAFGQHIESLYIPVDTCGCVHLHTGRWETAGRERFEPEFAVSRSAFQPFGCELIFFTLLRYLLVSEAARPGSASHGAAGRSMACMVEECERLIRGFREERQFARDRKIC